MVDSKGIAPLRSGNTNKKTPLGGRFLFGGLEGDRTLDLSDANRTLSQLSYEPEFVLIIIPKVEKVKGKDGIIGGR